MVVENTATKFMIVTITRSSKNAKLILSPNPNILMEGVAGFAPAVTYHLCFGYRRISCSCLHGAGEGI